eukprot:TCALIF_02237-PA protein Name:"Protein of unknown function" AED:0.56 eAED:0.56 QI:0/0/0/0.33/1/1/3/0/262
MSIESTYGEPSNMDRSKCIGISIWPLTWNLILLLLQLYGNPFQCDCRLLDFAHWVQQSGTPRTVEPQCLRPPRLANRTITSLALDSELACLPQVEAEIADDGRARGSGWATATKSSVGVTKAVEPGRRNVSLRCSVFAVPAAIVTWWRANRLVANSSVFEHLWEEQFYHIVEHRSNSHQMMISRFDGKGAVGIYLLRLLLPLMIMTMMMMMGTLWKLTTKSEQTSGRMFPLFSNIYFGICYQDSRRYLDHAEGLLAPPLLEL